MFIGHFAVGFAAKRWVPRVSLGWLLAAALLLDVYWPLFVLLGIERFHIAPTGNPFLNLSFDHYPWSHSLTMTLGWTLLVVRLASALGASTRTALVLGAAVFSHWVLDWITHLPDLPLWPGGRLTGLGLWRSVGGTIAVESIMLAAGAWLYLKATRPRDKIGAVGPWGYLALLAALYAQSIVAPSPPPGSERTIAVIALTAGPLFALLAWWIDHHRDPITSDS
jgi:hypothetical protein